MITKEQAMNAGHRTEFHAGTCRILIGPRGGSVQKVETWRVNGACKTWKTRPEDFSLPIKYGFNGPYSYITPSSAHLFHLASDCQPEVITK